MIIMTYSTTVQGVQCTSNVDVNASQPSGSLYTHTITFTVPFVNALAAAGVSVLDYVDNSYVSAQFAGAGHTISNFKASCPSSNTMLISYNCTSPTIIEAITLIIGIVLYIIGLITAGVGGLVAGLLIFVGAIGLVISSIYTEVVAPISKALTSIFGANGATAVELIGVVAVLGLVGWIAYKHYGKHSSSNVISSGSSKSSGVTIVQA